MGIRSSLGPDRRLRPLLWEDLILFFLSLCNETVISSVQNQRARRVGSYRQHLHNNQALRWKWDGVNATITASLLNIARHSDVGNTYVSVYWKWRHIQGAKSISSDWWGIISNPLLLESLKVEAMSDQEDQDHSGEWARSLVWVQTTLVGQLVQTVNLDSILLWLHKTMIKKTLPWPYWKSTETRCV